MDKYQSFAEKIES